MAELSSYTGSMAQREQKGPLNTSRGRSFCEFPPMMVRENEKIFTATTYRHPHPHPTNTDSPSEVAASSISVHPFCSPEIWSQKRATVTRYTPLLNMSATLLEIQHVFMSGFRVSEGPRRLDWGTSRSEGGHGGQIGAQGEHGGQRGAKGSDRGLGEHKG